jgi:hypothetical protein
MVPLFLRLNLSDMARPERRLCIATRNQHARFAQRIDLTASDLRIGFGAADVRDQDRQVAPTGLQACLFDQGL